MPIDKNSMEEETEENEEMEEENDVVEDVDLDVDNDEHEGDEDDRDENDADDDDTTEDDNTTDDEDTDDDEDDEEEGEEEEDNEDDNSIVLDHNLVLDDDAEINFYETRLSKSIISASWRHVLKLLEKEDSKVQAIRYNYDDGQCDIAASLLHLACLYRAPFKVVEKIYYLCPLAAMAPDYHGKLPIHYAAENCDDAKVINFLLKVFPLGAQTVFSDDKWLPIHEALRTEQGLPLNYDIIKQLVLSYPKGLMKKDCHGCIPLHFALRVLQEEVDFPLIELIQLLVGACRKFVRQTDGDGQLPVHLALKWNLSVDVVEYLINSFPKGLHRRDKRGRLPIHIACTISEYNAEDKVSIMRMLLFAYPESVIETCKYDDNDNLFPKEIIMLRSASLSSSSTRASSTELLALLDRYEKMYFVFLAHNHNLPDNEGTNNTTRKRSHEQIMSTVSNNNGLENDSTLRAKRQV